jgi:hypothetical protein
MGGSQSVEIPGGGTEGYHVLRVCVYSHIQITRPLFTICLTFQVQDNSPGYRAGLEAFFDFILAIGKTRLVRKYIHYIAQTLNSWAFSGPR